MSVERKLLSTVLDRPVQLYYAGDNVNIEIRCHDTEELIATVSILDLFDKDGNRFEDDLP